MSAVFDVIHKIAGDVGHAATEHRVGETFDERNVPAGFRRRADHEIHVGRQLSAEPGKHHEAAAAFEAGVARRHGNAGTELARDEGVTIRDAKLKENNDEK